jgi:type III secretion system low calcium response chaperone LcrH/SycD
MKPATEQLLAKFNQMDGMLSDKEKELCKEALIKVYEKGEKPKDAMGFSDEFIEYVYSFGYNLYNHGDYTKAKDIFTLLTIFVPGEARFNLALAATHHQRKEYGVAVEKYFLSALQDTSTPWPFYYMYDCYYKTGNLSDAEISLMQAIHRCKDNPTLSEVKQRSEMILEGLEQEIEQLKKEGKLFTEAPEENLQFNSASSNLNGEFPLKKE